MELVTRIEIDAPPERVWAVWADPVRWPEWTASVTRIEALDGELRLGARFRIVQPKLPVVVWEVTALEPGASWAWTARSPGVVTVGEHRVRAASAGAVADARLVQEGWIGEIVGRLYRGLSLRYLALEAEGLKRRSEADHASGLPTNSA